MTTHTNIFHEAEKISHLSLDQLIIYTRYRNHPQLSKADHQNFFRYELVSAVEAGGVCTTASCDNSAIAACAIKPLQWDSQHFGLPMARLNLAAAPRCPPAILKKLLEESISAARKKSIKLHISSEIDIDDYSCLNALLGLGAEILDIKREYRWSTLKGIKAPKFLSRVRDYHQEDKLQVLRLLEHVHFESRFSRDRRLDQKKSIELYRIWLENLLDRGENDRIALVMEKNNRIQACGAIEQQNLSHAGMDIQLMNNGIYISSTEATGRYYPIIYSLAERALSRFYTVQTCVSLNNHPAIRVLEKMNAGTESTRYALSLFL